MKQKISLFDGASLLIAFLTVLFLTASVCTIVIGGLPFLPAALSQSWMVFAAGNLGFVLYDLGFSGVIAVYTARVDRVLRKGR